MIEIFLSFMSGVLVALFSAYIGFKKYKTEKWVDKKIQNYFGLIDAINDLLVLYDSMIRNLGDGKVIDESSYECELSAISSKIQRIQNVGNLLFSKNASDLILRIDNYIYGIDRSKIELCDFGKIRDEVDDFLTTFVFITTVDIKEKLVFE